MKEGTKQTRITNGESEIGEAAISKNSNKDLAKAIVKASSNVQDNVECSQVVNSEQLFKN